MRTALLSLLTLTFAFQPVLASAYTIKNAERPSRRTLVKTQREQHAKNTTRTVPAPEKTVTTPSSYNKVGDYMPALPATGYSLGDEKAPITVVEFVDYACPFCATFATKTLSTIQSRYIKSGKVRFVFRNFPLTYHPAATAAAQAVECSRDQSESYALELQKKFFAESSDDDGLTQDDVYAAFESLKGIDTEKMYYCIDTEAKVPLIEQDMQDASDGGIGGVPSFWVLGPKGKTVLMQGALDFASFKKVFDTIGK
ncbi:DsbA family protein [Candidatus Peribacteria bacterium]|nr:MAG: DsbA family protein [Candidatus Peribacteria bacterium]